MSYLWSLLSAFKQPISKHDSHHTPLDNSKKLLNYLLRSLIHLKRHWFQFNLFSIPRVPNRPQKMMHVLLFLCLNSLLCVCGVLFFVPLWRFAKRLNMCSANSRLVLLFVALVCKRENRGCSCCRDRLGSLPGKEDILCFIVEVQTGN